MPVTAVVFDFDGTLVDTEWPIFERARAAIAEFGAELSEELWATHAVGVSLDEPYWDTIAGHLGLRVDRVAFDAAYAGITHIPSARDSAELMMGAAELIDDLDRHGIPMAIASGSEREWIDYHLHRVGLRDRFTTVIGRDHPEVTAGKPAPDLYRIAVAELGVDPAAAVAVEDTERGIESARIAAVGTVIAVPSRLTRYHDLSMADLRVDSLADLTLDQLAALSSAQPGA